MIQVALTNEILKRIAIIDENRFSVKTIELPQITMSRLRKNSKKKRSYAFNKIEGNPLSEAQANKAMERDDHKHLLKPEQEVRNYYLVLNLLEERLKGKTPFSKQLILEVQALVEKGASKDKIGLRGPTPPGVIFAVYDSQTGAPEYIPPEYTDIPELLTTTQTCKAIQSRRGLRHGGLFFCCIELCFDIFILGAIDAANKKQDRQISSRTLAVLSLR